MIPHSTHETNCSPATLCFREEAKGMAGCLHNILILKHEGVACVSISVNTHMLNGPELSFLFSCSASLSVRTLVVGPQGIIHTDWEAVLPLRRGR